MEDSDSKKAVSTTPADLARGIDMALDRCFRDLDVSDEARRLGIPEDVILALREGLLELREIANEAPAREDG